MRLTISYSLCNLPMARTSLKAGNNSRRWNHWRMARIFRSKPVASGIRYNVFSPIFLTNGQAYFGPKFPTEGLDGLDTRIPPELHRRDWGTYTFNNGRGVLKMPYADIPLRMEGDKLVITANQTDHRFFQIAFCRWCKV